MKTKWMASGKKDWSGQKLFDNLIQFKHATSCNCFDRMKKLGQPLALKAARLHHTAGNVIKVYNNEFLIVDMDEYSKKAHRWDLTSHSPEVWCIPSWFLLFGVFLSCTNLKYPYDPLCHRNHGLLSILSYLFVFEFNFGTISDFSHLFPKSPAVRRQKWQAQAYPNGNFLYNILGHIVIRFFWVLYLVITQTHSRCHAKTMRRPVGLRKSRCLAAQVRLRSCAAEATRLHAPAVPLGTGCLQAGIRMKRYRDQKKRGM